jgi:hypothetical protein
MQEPDYGFSTTEMSGPGLTDFKLRFSVTDQLAQERLCLAILTLDPRFSEVKPRRPKGGPDGARDIEALFLNQGKAVWGAVGFKKTAKDDRADKRWVRKKFKDDVDAAKKKNPSLWGFIFFTNDEVQQEYERIWQQLRNRPIEALVDLPAMTDRACRATLDVLTAVEEPAHYTDETLQCLAACPKTSESSPAARRRKISI